MSDQFYVRIRGRVQGPYDADKLRSLVRRGQLSRMHEVSVDKKTWKQAADFPDLFTSPEVAVAATVSEPDRKTAHQADGELELEQPVQDSTEWYYAKDQDQHGPVSFEQLRTLVQAGTVGGEDFVWEQRMKEWAPAKTIPGLHAAPGVSRGTTTSATSTESVVDNDTIRTLSDTMPWVSFLVISTLTISSCMVFLGIVSVLLGVRHDNSDNLLSGLVLLVYAGIGITGGILLGRYKSGMKRFMASRASKHFDIAFRSLKTFWIYVSILLIITLVIFLGLAISVFSIGLVGF